MPELDEIRDAIATLERLRAESTPGVWAHLQVVADYSQIDNGDSGNPLALIGRNIPDGDLIVTLHRTIDAQLAILQGGVSIAHTMSRVSDAAAADWAENELALARAINGDA